MKVFDKNSVYLPTKKIGKRNPREKEIKADNEARQEWNRTADMALVSGISEAKILEVKRTEKKISERLDKLPDIFKEYSNFGVHAFMATYREAKAIVEQYSRDLVNWERQVKEKHRPQKQPEKESASNWLRKLQEQDKQQPRKKKSFDRDSL